MASVFAKEPGRVQRIVIIAEPDCIDLVKHALLETGHTLECTYGTGTTRLSDSDIESIIFARAMFLSHLIHKGRPGERFTVKWDEDGKHRYTPRSGPSSPANDTNECCSTPCVLF